VVLADARCVRVDVGVPVAVEDTLREARGVPEGERETVGTGVSGADGVVDGDAPVV